MYRLRQGRKNPATPAIHHQFYKDLLFKSGNSFFNDTRQQIFFIMNSRFYQARVSVNNNAALTAQKYYIQFTYKCQIVKPSLLNTQQGGLSLCIYLVVFSFAELLSHKYTHNRCHHKTSCPAGTVAQAMKTFNVGV